MSDAVVMPVYNEAESIRGVLDAVRRYFDGTMIVVDDGSTDGTAGILAERDDIVLVHLAENCGYGCALTSGFAIARELGATRLVTMDCDGQHEPAHIPQFLEELETRAADIVSGSRYLPQSRLLGEAPPTRREINERITREINSVTGWHLTDAFCGFKAYHVSGLARLRLRERGYGMPLELWAKAWRAGLRVCELAVERIYFDHDRSFGSDLDDPERRWDYYQRVWRTALEADE